MSDPDSAFEDLMNRTLFRIHKYNTSLKTLIKLTAQAGKDCSGLLAAVHILSEICRTMEDIVLLGRIEGYQGDVKELVPVLKHARALGQPLQWIPETYDAYVALGICNQVEFIILCQAKSIFEHTDITDVLKVWKKKKGLRM